MRGPFDAVLEELREATHAGRVTLRLESDDAPFPVVAETLALGAPSLLGDGRVDPTETPTFQLVERERRRLIQNDCSRDPPHPGADLIDLYGVRAQMLGPIEANGRLVGVISVHDTVGPREWTTTEIAALDTATRGIRELLTDGARPPG